MPGVLTGPYPGEVLQGSRSGVGLVPVAVNDYSAQKCRCKPGAGLVSPVSLLHCPGHTQQEIADAVGMAQQSLADRLKVLPDLDKCPKSVKIAFISSI